MERRALSEGIKKELQLRQYRFGIPTEFRISFNWKFIRL